MKYLLDTCTVSDFARGDAATLGKIKAAAPADLAISSVTAMEIRFGLALNPKMQPRKLRAIVDFLDAIAVAPFGALEADAAGELRAELQRKGKPVGAYDLLIAGTALACGLRLVTSNVTEFGRIRGLVVENWRR
jgi:tRNA(fMet)-specific endonuclease VapC